MTIEQLRIQDAIRRIPDQLGTRAFLSRAGHGSAVGGDLGFDVFSVAIDKINHASEFMARGEAAPTIGWIDRVKLRRTVNDFGARVENRIVHQHCGGGFRNTR